MGSSERAILSFPSVVISSSLGTLYRQLGRVVQTAGESFTDSSGEFYRQLGRMGKTDIFLEDLAKPGASL